MSARVGAVVLAGGRSTRLPAPGTKHLMPVPGPGSCATLLDHVLDRLGPLDDVLVATGHRAESIARHLRARWPRVRPFTVPDVDDLPVSIAAAVAQLSTEITVVVEGDVLVPRGALRAYLVALQDSSGDELRLLAGPKPVAPGRCTFDLDTSGALRTVRPADGRDRHRWSVLAAAPGPAARRQLPGLVRPAPGLEGLAASPWHHAAARLIAAGRAVRVDPAPDGGVNVNTPAALAAATRYLATDP